MKAIDLKGALLGAMALTLPAAAQAQALACALPDRPLRVRPDLPDARDPRRVLPIGGYTLALSWSPQYCREHARDAAARFQCGGTNRFGFVLHGLWPDGPRSTSKGNNWPQYCRPTGLVPQPVIRRALCATPSPQLIQHEWAKHGTCIAGQTPASYFQQSNALYRRLRYPDMDALSRRRLTGGGLAAAIARVNPGLSPAMMRITADRRGWLDEVWLCLDTRQRYARCPAKKGGLAPAATVRIWRGGR